MHKNRKLKTLSVVIPVFNEAENIPKLYSEVLSQIYILTLDSYEFIFIDDGSNDESFKNLESLANNDSNITIIKFTRNFGHQYALLAGIKFARYDACVMMDADLEHPSEVIPKLVKRWEEGYDIVNALRLEGDESWFKKKTSKLFYKLMRIISPLAMPAGASDFRLIDKKVVKEISNIHESYLFLRGYFYWFGFSSSFVKYVKGDRFDGTTGFTVRKMLSLAFNALTTFSILPLRAAILIGSIVALSGFIVAAYIGYRWFFIHNIDVSSAAISAEILIIGGFIILFLGVIGEYIGRIFVEVKGIPPYVIENVITTREKDDL